MAGAHYSKTCALIRDIRVRVLDKLAPGKVFEVILRPRPDGEKTAAMPYKEKPELVHSDSESSKVQFLNEAGENRLWENTLISYVKLRIAKKGHGFCN